MFHLKNKAISKIIIFAIIATMVLWLIPAGSISAEEGSTTTTESSLPSDTTPPIISLIGNGTVEVIVGSTYEEAGATAQDAEDGDISDSIVIGGTVDTSTIGTYVLTYNVSDSAGNDAVEVTRTVNVVENQEGDEGDEGGTITEDSAPVIELIGEAEVDIDVGDEYIEAGATAQDAEDGDISDSIVIEGTVDTSTIGTYVLTYNVSDSAGNDAVEVTRTVNIVENTESVVLLDPVLTTLDADGNPKFDYAPEETVYIDGKGFAPNETYTIVVTRPDGTIVKGGGSPFIPGSDVVFTDGSGKFTYNYILNGVLGTYHVKAVDSGGNIVATTTFTDGSVIIRVTKAIRDSNGNIVTNDDTEFTIRLYKGVYPVGVEKNTLTITGIPGNNIKSFPAITNGGLTGTWDLWITEDSNPNYAVLISPEKTRATSGTIDFTITNTQIPPTTITISKEVYEPDGVTLATGDSTEFTIELWKTTDILGVPVPTSVETTVYLENGEDSGPIPVTPGVGYCVKEIAQSGYDTSYNPTGALGYSGVITPTNGSSNPITVINTQDGYEFKVTKVGLKYNNNPLDGELFTDEATFTLYKPDGTVKGTVTLDCNPLTIFTPDNYTWDKLADGTGYRLEESYTGLGNKYTYNSDLPGYPNYIFNISGADPGDITVNNDAIGTISAYKQDNLGSPLAGATIGLFANEGDADGDALQTTISTGVSSDPNVVFLDVPSGGSSGETYYIHEISAPLGYTPDPNWYSVSISDTNLNPVLDTPITNTANGIIILYKQDSFGHYLGGAEFGLYLSQDETSTPIATATSQAVTGEVKFEHLGYSTYYIREISAPTGFAPDENWYEVALTTGNSPYTFTDPIINVPGGTITVTKDVRAPDAISDADDSTEFTITLEKKDSSGNWVPVKTTKISEDASKVFSVPIHTWYRIVESDEDGYIEVLNTGSRYLLNSGDNADISIINKQKYAIITVTKTVLNNLSDDHIFWVKLNGDHGSLIEWHPVLTMLPTVFLVWPGTYSAEEKPDVNYNDTILPFPIILYNGLPQSSVTVGPGDVAFVSIVNYYTPQFGTVTVTKDVVRPDGCTQVSDDKEFTVKLQRLNLTLPDITDLLGITDLSDLSDLDLSFLSDLLGWEDVGTPQTVYEGHNAVFPGVEKDHIYRVVESDETGYMQICGFLPFYFDPDSENEQVDIINRQESVVVEVAKNVIGPDGSDVSDCNLFWVKLVSEDIGGCDTLIQLVNEDHPTYFLIWPGTYSVYECPKDCYDRVDSIGVFTLNPGEGTLCDPVELTVVNQQHPGTIIISKTGLMGKDSATFTLCDKKGNPIAGVDPITLTEGGVDAWKNLNWGKYTIKESYPCENLYTYSSVKYDPCGPFEIGCDDCSCNLTQKVKITNLGAQLKSAKIKINKTVIGTQLVSDVFKFTVDDGMNPPQEVTIGGNGGDSADITVYAGRTYTITETDAGTSFDITGWSSDIPASTPDPSDPKVTFDVTGCNYKDVDGKKVFFEDTRKKCFIGIFKNIDGLPATEGIFDFSGDLGDFTLPEGVNYNKQFEVECGIEYIVNESNLAAGFELNDITWAGNFTKHDKDITGKSFTFVVECPTTAGAVATVRNTITFDNHKIPGTVQLNKTDAISGVTLNGARFGLFLPDGTTKALDINGDEIPEVVTGDGIWPDGYAEFVNIPWGNYKVIEIDPPLGYLPREADITIDGTHLTIALTDEIADPRIPSQLVLTKTDSITGLRVAGATYNIYNSGGTLVEIVTTGPDGSVAVTLVNWGTYTVQEAAAPAGYLLDPTTYTITFGAATTSITLNVQDTPAGAGAPPTITVAGLTEGGIQVLGFTGVSPIIPIGGGSAIVAGLAMLLSTLRRRIIKR